MFDRQSLEVSEYLPSMGGGDTFWMELKREKQKHDSRLSQTKKLIKKSFRSLELHNEAS